MSDAARLDLRVPCNDCVHREVCRIRQSLYGRTLDAAHIELPDLAPELTARFAVVVECRVYLPEKTVRVRKAKAAPNWSPEQRAAAAERMRTRRAAGGVPPSPPTVE